MPDYRVALFEHGTVVADNTVMAQEMEDSDTFIGWISNWEFYDPKDVVTIKRVRIYATKSRSILLCMKVAEAQRVETDPYFDKWLTDWIEVKL